MSRRRFGVARALLRIVPLAFLLPAAGCSLWPSGRADRRAPAKVTLNRTLGEMTDLSVLSRLPDPAYRNIQASSYDRASKSPELNWFANRDVAQYIRVEEKEGRKEYVMMETEGPGCIVRVWSANPAGTLRIYLNGESQPALEAGMEDLLGGRHPLFPEPLAGVRSRGWNLHFPILYSKGAKVTSDKGGFYYHVNHRVYPAGTEVEDFSLAGVEAHAEAISKVRAKLDPAYWEAESLAAAPRTVLNPGTPVEVFSFSGRNREIDQIRFLVESPEPEKALRGIVLAAFFDGEEEPSIECPLGDFFGTSPGANPYSSLPFTILPDGTMICRWPMPFRRRAEFLLRNFSAAPVKAAWNFRVRKAAEPWREGRSMHFHSAFTSGFQIPTRPFRDYTILEAEGKGIFAGAVLSVVNPVRGWWGEGDEKIYLDGESFPSTFGTGTEDYFGYAWCDPAPFGHAYHNQTRCDGPGNYGYTSVNRFHVLDALPFDSSFKFDIEVWHSKAGINVDYASAAYWYQLPGGGDSMGRLEPASLRLPAPPPIAVFDVKGAIEAEKLKAETSGGRRQVQDMEPFDEKFSGGRQVWFTGGKPGDSLTLRFDAPAAGEYEVFANFAKAHDYGKARAAINGAPAGGEMDFYGEGVHPTGEISLGRHSLTAEGNLFTLTVTGTNEKAVPAYMLGVDYLRLAPAAP